MTIREEIQMLFWACLFVIIGLVIVYGIINPAWYGLMRLVPGLGF